MLLAAEIDAGMQADEWTLSACPEGSLCSAEVQFAIAVPASSSAAIIANALYSSTSSSRLQVSCFDFYHTDLHCWPKP